jgi:ADP-ribosyl-[dinitrogen reductase] hydrolase
VARSSKWNTLSQANGSLMRILPLAIWASRLPDEQLVRAARLEATLSHPHQICQDCNAVYCLLVAHLIHHPGDRDGALQKAAAFVDRDDVHATVRQWFHHESLDASALDCRQAIGHVRWAFALAIYHLRQGSSYEQAVEETLLKGGDTDTNAAIVGGLMGALHGVEAIPEFMREPVLAFDCSAPGRGQKRPAVYRSAQAQELTRALLKRADEASS